MVRRRVDTRRRFLRVTGTAAVASLAGCGGGNRNRSGDGGGEGGGGSGGQQGTQQQAGRGLGPVPDEYATAAAQGGTTRDPDSVARKQAVDYQSTPRDGQQCSNCRFYIPDKNGDGLGACAVVEGMIEPKGWCSSFVEYGG